MKKGFTLIELLAVIVILAIIALIAVPIVLNIINDSKESSLLRSAEFYLDAVEYTIADAFLYHGGLEDGTYPITKDGHICKIELDNQSNCPKTGNVSNTLVVEVNGDKPTGGSITINGGNISDVNIVLDEKTIVKNSDGELVYLTLDAVCTLQEGSTKNTIGAKYSCDFGGGARNFYILELGSNKVQGSTLKDDEVALILEGNYDTTTQAWCDQEGANPSNNVCAADGLTSKLDEISGVWTKLGREQIGIPSAIQVAAADGMAYLDMFIISSTNAWLYNWPGTDNTSFRYWTSTPYANDSSYAWYVFSDGTVDYAGTVNYDSSCGVRPVINLKL